jgi:hypothetical protein
MIDIDAGIAKARARAEKRETVVQPVIFNDAQIGVKLTAMSDDDWRAYTLLHPPREAVRLDLNAATNLDSAVREYQGVILVDGDETDDLLAKNEEGETVYRWPEVYDTLSRQDRENLAFALWMIHDSWYQEALKTAGKARTGLPQS